MVCRHIKSHLKIRYGFVLFFQVLDRMICQCDAEASFCRYQFHKRCGMPPRNHRRNSIGSCKDTVRQTVFKCVLLVVAHCASVFPELEPLVPKQKVGIVPVPFLGVALVAQRLHVVYAIHTAYVDRYYVINM